MMLAIYDADSSKYKDGRLLKTQLK